MNIKLTLLLILFLNETIQDNTAKTPKIEAKNEQETDPNLNPKNKEKKEEKKPKVVY